MDGFFNGESAFESWSNKNLGPRTPVLIRRLNTKKLEKALIFIYFHFPVLTSDLTVSEHGEHFGTNFINPASLFIVLVCLYTSTDPNYTP